MNACMNQPPLYGYIGFYEQRRHELRAASLYDAKQAALAHFRPPKAKAHLVSVVLAERDGQPVTHIPDF
jgi:hypothetical protein